MVLGGIAVRRRHLARAAPHWSSTAKGTVPGGGAPATDLDTFAHFAAVTEASFNGSPGSAQTFDRHEPSLETASLDTLLGDLNEDAVEERALRDAWAAAQSGLSDDPGSSGAILKAIADAERDLAASDISFTLDELEVNLDDHIIPEDDSRFGRCARAPRFCGRAARGILSPPARLFRGESRGERCRPPSDRA